MAVFENRRYKSQSDKRLFHLPKEYLSQSSFHETKRESVRRLIDALRFSSVILFKIGYRDTTVSEKIIGIDHKYVVWIQWALGFYRAVCIVVIL